jgi:hypothetical protein
LVVSSLSARPRAAPPNARSLEQSRDLEVVQ